MAKQTRLAKGAALIVAALLTGMAQLGGLPGTISTANATDVTVWDVNFDDGTTGAWSQSGGPTLSYVADPDNAANQVLEISGRTNTWDSIQSPTGVLKPGQTYTASMDVRLPAGVAGPADIHLILDSDTPTGNQYMWVPGSTSVTDAAWTTVTGTFTVPADATSPNTKLAIDTASGNATTSYLVDNILVTTPSPVTTVWNVDFSATPCSPDPWMQDGSPTLTCTTDPDDATNQVMQVTDRTSSYFGLQSPAGVLTPGTTYTASMRVRLLAGDAGPADIHFTLNSDTATGNQYMWVPGGTSITDAEWTTVSGTFTVPADATSPNTKLYIDSGGATPSPSYLVDDIVVTTPIVSGPSQTVLQTGFENNSTDNNMGSWTVRNGSSTSAPVADVSTAYAHSGSQSACVTNRTSMGDGLMINPTGVLDANSTYTFDAWARFIPDGAANEGALVLSLHSGSDPSSGFSNLVKWTNVTSDGWTELTGTITIPADSDMLYFETPYNGTDLTSFCVDDITIATPTSAPDLTNTPIKSTTPDFPVGVAVSAPQIAGQSADLLLYHDNQVTPENAMKEDAWYDAAGNFIQSPVALQIMDFAQANNIPVYGHNLVWYENNGTPSWFFNVSASDDTTLISMVQAGGAQAAQAKQILTDRLHAHILGVAQTLSQAQYGCFGSSTNPLTAFDVVNEAINDNVSPATQGLRESQWYKILGPDFINMAFTWANQYFDTPGYDATTDTGGFACTDTTANPADRPVKLFLNDFNFETDPGKVQRTVDEVNALTAAGVPIDGVGDQSHLSAGMVVPVTSVTSAMSTLATAKNTWGQPLLVAITELDAPTGTPSPSQTQLIQQGYYYQQLYQAFRDWAAAHPDASNPTLTTADGSAVNRAGGTQLYSVTLWGLDDAQWWRYATYGPAMPFDTNLQTTSTYVYCGIVGAANCTLPPLQMSGNAFGVDSTTGDLTSPNSPEWAKLPTTNIGDGSAAFETRWTPDALSVYVTVTDPTAGPDDAVTFVLNGHTYVVTRSGAVTVDGVTATDVPVNVVATSDGYKLVATLPLTGAAQGDTAAFDVSVAGVNGTTQGWDSGGAIGTLTLVGPLTFVQVPEAATTPAMDGTGADPVWADAASVDVNKVIPPNTTDPTGGATGVFKLLWQGNTLYVLANVTDATPDVSSSNAYEQDSIEIFVDRGNSKGGAYTSDVTQMRISSANAVSFGTGDKTVAASWLQSATSQTATGYIVEAAVDLDGLGGAGSFQGLNLQINDGTAGHRTANNTWADDPTGNSYQSDALWGVAQLMPGQGGNGGDNGGNTGGGSTGGGAGGGSVPSGITVQTGGTPAGAPWPLLFALMVGLAGAGLALRVRVAGAPAVTD